MAVTLKHTSKIFLRITSIAPYDEEIISVWYNLGNRILQFCFGCMGYK